MQKLSKRFLFFSAIFLSCMLSLTACNAGNVSLKPNETTQQNFTEANSDTGTKPKTTTESESSTAEQSSAQPTVGYDVWDGSVATEFAGGSGTQEDPYIIETAAQLAFLSEQICNNRENTYSDKCYKLNNNLDMNGHEWLPIGSVALDPEYQDSTNGVFTGSFDGNGHIITRLYITDYADQENKYCGLFGTLAGDVSNLNIEAVSVSSLSATGLIYIGGVAGVISNSTIKNCTVTGLTVSSIIESNQLHIGGIAGGTGYNASIQSCQASGYDISPTSLNGGEPICVGGILGSAAYATLNECNTSGTIKVLQDNKNEDVEGLGIYIGGIIGYDLSSSVVSNCSTTCIIEASASTSVGIGGISGKSQQGSYQNCHTTGSIAVHSFSFVCGGITGSATNATLQSCSSDMSIDASGRSDSMAGGLVGLASTITANDSFAVGNVNIAITKESSYLFAAGGFAGGANNAQISNCYATGHITAKGTEQVYAAGFIAVGGGTFSNCYAKGNVYTTGSPEHGYVGGFYGYGSPTLENCYRFEEQIISHNDTPYTANDGGTPCPASQIEEFINQFKSES